MGPHISHKQIMTDNEIDKVKEKVLSDLFEYTNDARNQESESEKVILNFWARQNLELKDKCQTSSSPLNKKQLMDQIDEATDYFVP